MTRKAQKTFAARRRFTFPNNLDLCCMQKNQQNHCKWIRLVFFFHFLFLAKILKFGGTVILRGECETSCPSEICKLQRSSDNILLDPRVKSYETWVVLKTWVICPNNFRNQYDMHESFSIIRETKISLTGEK